MLSDKDAEEIRELALAAQWLPGNTKRAFTPFPQPNQTK